MTEAMGKQIRDLRLKGLGYQTIAIVIGSTKETVRYYCKTHGLMGDAELVQLNYEEHLKHPENCKNCGAKLMRNRYSGKKFFCSDKCRQSWWQKHREEIQFSDTKTYGCTCQYCKKDILPRIALYELCTFQGRMFDLSDNMQIRWQTN